MPAAKDTKTFTVAPRRHVIHDGKPYDAGAELVLEREEGERLQKLGFFLDVDGLPVAKEAGPPVVKGVEIKEI